MERIDPIGPRAERTTWVLPVVAPTPAERRDSDADGRQREQRRPPRHAPPAEREPLGPGHVDLTA